MGSFKLLQHCKLITFIELKTAMKVFVILALAAVAVMGKKCNKGDSDGASLTEETCEADLSTCTSPKFVEYTGMSSQKYGCGTCADTKTCASCTTADDKACNEKVAAPADAKTFKCYEYEYDTEGKKFTAKKDVVTCNALKDTAVKCNSPGEKAAADYKQQNMGCGPCATGAVTDKTCTECDKDECNSAATFAFIMVPLLATIYNLF